jgi:hypothetical protein
MLSKSLFVAVALAAGCVASAADKPKVTAFERSQGWRLLFDGGKITEWRGYRAEKVPANWQAQGDSLAGSAGTVLVTTQEFRDFELQFDWCVAEGGQGAVLFRVNEDLKSPDESALRMNLAGADAALGGNGLMPPDRGLTPQFGVWYRSRLVVFGEVVEHWINGERVAAYSVGSPDWKRAVAASALAGAKELGRLRDGRIALAGDKVEFRNLKVRAL